MSATPEFNEDQLATARAGRWHQDGDALLTLEAAREWVEAYGLVLFAPRGQQLASPAPSLVEATLGKPTPAPTAAETEIARGLVARMVADGAALPLNLLGGPGDAPDFLASAQVFSYIFTLRGDKGWKQPPSTSGPVKVSPLALKVYESLAEKGAQTAAEIASELGRELTESAAARALGEMWGQLRVVPLLQQDGSATLWELTSRRFTKAMKAGANAGQPTALSALISLYLGQAFAATEEEIETFLSPLAARSRVRDVLHGLTAGRQLEAVVLEGKTLLYIPGVLPEFPTSAAVAASAESGEEPATAPVKKVGTGRIRSFSGDRKSTDEFRGKPVRDSGTGRTRVGGTRPPSRFGQRGDAQNDRERRPFRREGGAAPAKPGFTRPWEEGRKPRPERTTSTGGADSFRKFRKPAPEDRKPLGDREQAGLPPEQRSFTKRRFERESEARDAAKRPYKPREGSAGERGSFKPRSFERGGKPGGFAAKRPFKPRETEGGERPFTKRPYTPRPTEGQDRGPSKPRFDRGGKPGGFGPKRPFAPRKTEGGEGSFPKRPYKPRADGPGERPRPNRPYKPRGEAGGDRGGLSASRGFGPKKFGANSAGRTGGRPGTKFGGRPGGFGPKKFGGKPAGRPGGKRAAPGEGPAKDRRPESEE